MTTLNEQRVAIVGFGLMGGSLAMALRAHVDELVAIDLDEQALAYALRQGLADRVSRDPAAALKQVDLAVLATPVRTIRQQLDRLPDWCPEGCSVVDLGSTKAEICQAMSALPAAFEAIGGHPMCGKERSGLSAAEPDLFLGQTFVLCRNARTTIRTERLALELVEAIGGRPLFLTPEAHDILVAMTSHMPYLLATILMGMAAQRAASDENVWLVSASGFRDMTRLAGSNPDMMLDILMTNREAVRTQLSTFREIAERVNFWLETGDERALKPWISAAREAYLTRQDQKRD